MGKQTVLAITMGDPAGVGAEIIAKALYTLRGSACVPVVIGDYAAMQKAIRITGAAMRLNLIASPGEAADPAKHINLIATEPLSDMGWEYGSVQALCGKAAFSYIEKAIQFALNGDVQAVVTAPVNKEALHLAGISYAGHTEIFAKLTGTDTYAMMLTCASLRVIHATTHVALREACGLITRQRVYDVIHLAEEAMRAMGIASPRIAVAGLNPHSSENGLFGEEERREILPAIKQAASKGIRVEGPIPPDTVFVKAAGGDYDIVVAMYHDQGHIPIKLLGFRLQEGKGGAVSGVNCTVGLPIIRTSVDHGTAFDLAGTGAADAGSMVDAIQLAEAMARHREEARP